MTREHKKYALYGILGLSVSTIAIVLARRLLTKRGYTPLEGDPVKTIRWESSYAAAK